MADLLVTRLRAALPARLRDQAHGHRGRGDIGMAALLAQAANEIDRLRAARGSSDLDGVLIDLAGQGASDIVLRSRPAPHGRGHHAVSWSHQDGQRATTEGHTARVALRRALRATESRIRGRGGR